MISENKRTIPRIPVQMNALMLDPETETYANCSLMDLSSEGIGILCSKQESIRVGSQYHFIINIAPKTTEAAGTVVWSKKFQTTGRYNCAAGIILSGMDKQDSHNLLSFAQSQLYRFEKYWAKEKTCNRPAARESHVKKPV